MDGSSQRPRSGAGIAALVAIVLVALPAAGALHEHSTVALSCSVCAALYSVAVVEGVATAAAQFLELGAPEDASPLACTAPARACHSIRGPPPAA